MKPVRLYPGLYKVTTISGRIYLIENVTRDVELRPGERAVWNISEQKTRDCGMIYRDAPCDAASTLKDAVTMIEGWE